MGNIERRKLAHQKARCVEIICTVYYIDICRRLLQASKNLYGSCGQIILITREKMQTIMNKYYILFFFIEIHCQTMMVHIYWTSISRHWSHLIITWSVNRWVSDIFDISELCDCGLVRNYSVWMSGYVVVNLVLYLCLFGILKRRVAAFEQNTLKWTFLILCRPQSSENVPYLSEQELDAS